MKFQLAAGRAAITYEFGESDEGYVKAFTALSQMLREGFSLSGGTEVRVSEHCAGIASPASPGCRVSISTMTAAPSALPTGIRTATSISGS